VETLRHYMTASPAPAGRLPVGVPYPGGAIALSARCGLPGVGFPAPARKRHLAPFLCVWLPALVITPPFSAWLRQRNFAPSFERRNFAPTKKPDGLDPLLTACPKLDYRKISDLIPIAGCLADFNKANFGLVIIRTGCRPADPARLQRQRNFAPSSFARLNFQPTYYTDSQNCFDTLI